MAAQQPAELRTAALRMAALHTAALRMAELHRAELRKAALRKAALRKAALRKAARAWPVREAACFPQVARCPRPCSVSRAPPASRVLMATTCVGPAALASFAKTTNGSLAVLRRP